jgi:hypothetical protein
VKSDSSQLNPIENTHKTAKSAPISTNSLKSSSIYKRFSIYAWFLAQKPCKLLLLSQLKLVIIETSLNDFRRLNSHAELVSAGFDLLLNTSGNLLMTSYNQISHNILSVGISGKDFLLFIVFEHVFFKA